MEYILQEKSKHSWDRFTNQKYSQIIGRNILARIIKHLGVDILYQFGLNNSIINRMIDKWVLGWEVDLLSQIWTNKDKIKKRFIHKWEFELFKDILFVFKEYFYLKPVMILWLSKWTTAFNNELNYFSKSTSYEQFMLSSYRQLIDRTLLYDALIFYIVELYKLYEISKDNLYVLFTIDLSQTKVPNSNALLIYYYKYKDFTLDTRVKQLKTIIQKKEWAVSKLPILYSKIRDAYTAQWIGNIQQYCIDACWPIIIEYKNHKFVNFAHHYKYNKLPCMILQNIRDSFVQISEQTK